jgi:hypothetical protein
MALCAVPDQNNNLVVVNQTVENCTGFVLLESGDSLHFIERLFDPNFLTAADYQTVFQLGMSMPLLAYVTAWAFQTVINFISKDKES